MGVWSSTLGTVVEVELGLVKVGVEGAHEDNSATSPSPVMDSK